MKIEELNDREFFAWLAGFFDGEGHITIYVCQWHRPYGFYEMNIGFSQSRRESLDAIQKRLGFGHVNAYKTGFGKVAHHLTIYSIKRSKAILTKMAPYLQVKQREAELALNFPTPRPIPKKDGKGRFVGRLPDLETKKRQEAMRQELRRLNAN